MTFDVTIGIDPGLTGAIAILADGAFVRVHDMPVVTDGTRRRVDGRELGAILRATFRELAGAHFRVALERVGPVRGQGLSSTWSFGDSFGSARTAAEVLRLPLVQVTPQRWKKSAGLIGTPKDAARLLAARLYPLAPLARKKDCGRADAILIARYASKL